MEKIIKFDRELRQGSNSYNFFASIHEDIRKREFQRIILDLTEYRYINPVYGVLIGSMPHVGRLYDCNIIIRFNPKDYKSFQFLNNLGILEYYNKSKYKRNSIDLSHISFNKYDSLENAFPTVGKILETAPVQFSDNARVTMESKLAELFANAFTHAKSEIGLCCSGYIAYNIFYFSVYDAGVGIQKNVSEYLNKEITPVDSVKWAFKQGNSTLNSKLDYPRGAGLNLFDSFARANNGIFDLVSGKAYRKLHNSVERYYTLDKELQGTIISIGIRSDKISRYVLNIEKENNKC